MVPLASENPLKPLKKSPTSPLFDPLSPYIFLGSLSSSQVGHRALPGFAAARYSAADLWEGPATTAAGGASLGTACKELLETWDCLRVGGQFSVIHRDMCKTNKKKYIYWCAPPCCRPGSADVCVCVCVCVSVSVSVYVYMYIYIHITYIYTYIHIDTHTFIICIYPYTYRDHHHLGERGDHQTLGHAYIYIYLYIYIYISVYMYIYVYM